MENISLPLTASHLPAIQTMARDLLEAIRRDGLGDDRDAAGSLRPVCRLAMQLAWQLSLDEDQQGSTFRLNLLRSPSIEKAELSKETRQKLRRIWDCVRKAEWVASDEETQETAVEALKAFLGPEDGPDENRNVFHWKGDEYKIEPIPCRLLRFLWAKTEVSRQAAEEHTWGHDRDVTENMLKAALKKANLVLTQASVPFNYSRNGNRLFKS
jgi:hypothetical protein